MTNGPSHNPHRYNTTSCNRLPSTASSAELRQAHRDKMIAKARRFDGDTEISREVAEHKRKGTLHQALGKHWRSRDGRKRTAPPRLSIWPEGKTAKPGRMA